MPTTNLCLKSAALTVFVLLTIPAQAQKLGVGGTGIDEAQQLPSCDKPLGTMGLVEEEAKSDPRLDAPPRHLRAMFKLAKEQHGNMSQVVELSGGDVP